MCLQLWSCRCEATRRLGLHDLLAQELSSLFSILPPSHSLSEPPHVSPLIPFDLILTHASLHGLLGQCAPTIDALFQLLQACKKERQREKDEAARQLWQVRMRSVGLTVLNFLTKDKVSLPSLFTRACGR